MTAQQLFFAYFAVMIILSSVLVITRKNAVHSVMWMLLLFVHIAGIYLFLNAEFLAAIQIIVYAGAILVLYLFVIMLLNVGREDMAQRFQNQWPLGFIAGIILIVSFVLTMSGITVSPEPGTFSVGFIQSQGIMMAIGKVLFTEYLLPFEIVSLILLVAIIGAVVLAKKKLG